MLPALLRSLVTTQPPRSKSRLALSNPDLSDSEDEDQDIDMLGPAIFRLPPKVFARILDFALTGSDPSDSEVVEQVLPLLTVCSEWCEAAIPALYASPPLRGPQTFAHFIRILSLSAAPNSTSFFEYHPLVEALNIEGPAADNIEMGDLETALGLCPNLRSFRLASCLHISSKIVQSLADYAPHLTALSLEGCPVGDGYISDLILGCPNLTSVNLSATNVSFASFEALLTGLQSLESLTLDGMQPAEVEQESSRPRRSSFIGSPPPPTTRRVFVAQKGTISHKLSYVSLSGSKPSEKDLKNLAMRAPNLKTLVLSGCENLTDNHVVSFLDQLAIPRQTATPHTIQLECLDLDGCHLLTSVTPGKISSIFAGVSKLGPIDPPTHDKPTNMLDLIDGIGRLKFMTLSPLKSLGLSATEVDADSIRTLIRECGALVEVRLDGCDLISGTFIESVAQDCWALMEAEREEARLLRQKKLAVAAASSSAVDMARKGSLASRLPVPVNKRSTVVVIGGVSTPPSSPHQTVSSGVSAMSSPPSKSTMPYDWCRLIGPIAMKRVATFEGTF
ncbi:hypothetical protein BDR26DRAFT_390496 [Obelidium mucronatum]|nr:hypothetical protein BDR26DRAFT_390496 [Obelidium mucronatum]